jgi:pimeloyl-ACP methyl ester carboxylesterase
MVSVAANGITIEYEEWGSGEPLLLVMGLGRQLTDWPDDLVEALVGQGFRVIALDNRDAGLSTQFMSVPPTRARLARSLLSRRPVESEYLLADMADDIAGLLDALDLDGAHVAGVSMGAMIAQTLAIDHPRRVRSLTSIMSTTGNRRVGQPTPRLMLKMTRGEEPSRDRGVEQAVEVFRTIAGPTFDEEAFRRKAAIGVARSWTPEGTGRQTAAIFASADRTAALGSVTAPTVVVHGMVDPLVQPSGGEATAAAIPGSRLILYPEMGHDLPVTRRAEMAEEIARNAARAGMSRPALGTRA